MRIICNELVGKYLWVSVSMMRRATHHYLVSKYLLIPEWTNRHFKDLSKIL